MFPDETKVVGALTERLVRLVTPSRRPVSVALAGGTTPMRTYQAWRDLFSGEPKQWQNLHFFWGDERCVPPDHPESNYGGVNRALLSHIPISDENIHRIQGERDPVDEAKRYSGVVQTTLVQTADGWPQFDWVLLGVGEDGHVASLFPGQETLECLDRVATVATHPESGQQRISLTLPVINRARLVTMVVTGRQKASIVARIFGSRQDPYLPAQRVQPIEGTLVWILDRDAAAELDLRDS
jgi:6-phosphogluconolactonase